MGNEEQILVKVDKTTKEDMKKMELNWSAEIRGFIKARLKEKRNLALAVALNDSILRVQTKKRTDTTAIIRKFRDTRYGATGS